MRERISLPELSKSEPVSGIKNVAKDVDLPVPSNTDKMSYDDPKGKGEVEAEVRLEISNSSEGSSKDEDLFIILSLDGGGIRCIISLLILKEIEKRLGNKSIIDRIHLIAGTSSGGIIALALGTRNPETGLLYTVDDLINLYCSEGEQVFRTNEYTNRVKVKTVLPFLLPIGLLGFGYLWANKWTLSQVYNTILAPAFIPTLFRAPIPAFLADLLWRLWPLFKGYNNKSLEQLQSEFTERLISSFGVSMRVLLYAMVIYPGLFRFYNFIDQRSSSMLLRIIGFSLGAAAGGFSGAYREWNNNPLLKGIFDAIWVGSVGLSTTLKINFYSCFSIMSIQLIGRILDENLMMPLLHSRYVSPRKSAFKRYFGETRLSDLEKDVFIPSKNITTEMNYFFTKERESDRSLKVATVAAATSAVPAFFPAVSIHNEKFIDGAIECNNPVNEAWKYAEQHKGAIRQNTFIISIGNNGEAENENSGSFFTSFNFFKKWPFARERDVENLREIFSDDNSFVRIQPRSESGINLNDTRDSTIDNLRDIAKQTIRENEHELSIICTRLNGRG